MVNLSDTIFAGIEAACGRVSPPIIRPAGGRFYAVKGGGMEMCARTIRLLAAIEQEDDCFLLASNALRLRYADTSAGEWQGSSDSNRGPSVLETDALTN